MITYTFVGDWHFVRGANNDYGKSDKDAGYPSDRPVSPADLSATIFTALGIDPDLRIPAPEGRPTSLVGHGQALTELFG